MITLIKKSPASKDAEAQKQSKLVDVLGRIYGRTHLLSSERSNNIPQAGGNVKPFFRLFCGDPGVFPRRPPRCPARKKNDFPPGGKY
jgi:hypothetical protein